MRGCSAVHSGLATIFKERLDIQIYRSNYPKKVHNAVGLGLKRAQILPGTFVMDTATTLTRILPRVIWRWTYPRTAFPTSSFLYDCYKFLSSEYRFVRTGSDHVGCSDYYISQTELKEQHRHFLVHTRKWARAVGIGACALSYLYVLNSLPYIRPHAPLSLSEMASSSKLVNFTGIHKSHNETPRKSQENSKV